MDVSDQELEDARRIAAKVVARMGDKFWPLFELVDEEWKRRQERSARIAACLSEPSLPRPARRRKKPPRGYSS